MAPLFPTHVTAADHSLITSLFFINVMGPTLVAIAVFGPTFAPFPAVLTVFSLCQIRQLCCTLPPAPGMIWRDPGFLSVLLICAVRNDFFFSSHTALAVPGAIQLRHLAPWRIDAAAVRIALGEAVIVLVLRAYHTLDVIAGVFAAWFAADMAGRLARAFDALPDGH